MSELQDRAPKLIEEAQDAPIGITRYGRMVAALISPEDLASLQELEEAADRALWALDAGRSLRDLAAGEVDDWDEVAAKMRRRYPRKK